MFTITFSILTHRTTIRDLGRSITLSAELVQGISWTITISVIHYHAHILNKKINLNIPQKRPNREIWTKTGSIVTRTRRSHSSLSSLHLSVYPPCKFWKIAMFRQNEKNIIFESVIRIENILMLHLLSWTKTQTVERWNVWSVADYGVGMTFGA